MKFYDAFSGIGGFHKGIKQAHPDWQCVGACEIDKYAKQIYKKHFPEVNIDDDIRKVDELPKGTDLLCGGFPCQAFSIAGKRLGFNDTRGTLFYQIARLAKNSRPKILFLENVKGLLSHDDGRTANVILATLDELGYNAQWQVLDSQDWGLAQHRERVFFIANLRKEPRPKIFPLRKDDKKIINKQILSKSQQTAQTLMARDYANWNGNFVLKQIGTIGKDSEATRVYSAEGIVRTIKNGGGMGAKTGLYTIPKIAPTLTGGGHSGGLHSDMLAIPVLTPDRENKRQNGRRFKEPGEPSFTLTAQDRHGIMYPKIANCLTPDAYLATGKRKRVDGKAVLTSMYERRIRRLTPIECERLQGFPDNWTKGISDSQRYKCLGNAVSVPVIKAIAERFNYG